MEVYATEGDEEAAGIIKASSQAIQTSEFVLRDGHGGLEGGNSNLRHQYKEEVPSGSISLLPGELPKSLIGWPLLWKTAPESQQTLRISKARNLSVVEWVMSLPTRSTLQILQDQVDMDLNKADVSFDSKDVNYSLQEMEDEEGSRSQEIEASEEKTAGGTRKPDDQNFGLVDESKAEVSTSSASSLYKESPQSRPGWPLLRLTASSTSDSSRYSEARDVSPVKRLVSLPYRSNSVTRKTQAGLVSYKKENHVEKEICYSVDTNTEATEKLLNDLEFLKRAKLAGCRWLSYEELNRATSHFPPESFVGEGGCSNVYKGRLPCGRSVAVKILKSYKEAWMDFCSEMNIVSILKHKHITPLIGVCLEDDLLISVYDFFPMGSLEENLHGQEKRSALPWEVRFKVAIAVAEALDYLHNECSPPVIHRDVKSSNILLSDEFQPQLSDFGLAIWGPTYSTYVTHDDVVGTFGYIAPEYFMRGRVSDKVDVYSFGVVLLELLSGRKPIGSENLKGQRSLVKWAKPLLESGDIKALLDPKLYGKYDVDQMQRMLLAASLCIRQSARLRPGARQVLKILTEHKDTDESVNSHATDFTDLGNQDEDDDFFFEFDCKRHEGSALIQSENDTSSLSSGDTSLRNAERPRGFMLRDYLKERQD